MSNQFSREQIEEAKRRLRREDMWRQLTEALKVRDELDKVARSEMEAEEAGLGTSDEITKEQAIRVTLEEACRAVREGCGDHCGFGPGTNPSKANVAKHVNLSAPRIKQLWMRVRDPGEEWPPC